MGRTRILRGLVLAGVAAVTAGTSPGEGIKEEKVTFEGITFRVVKVDPERMQVVWKGDDGKPLQTFDRVQAHFAKKGKKVVFLANAGIYEPGWIPSGLHIEGGQELHPLNLKEAPGNFYLKPNGVFAVCGKEGAGERLLMMESAAFGKAREGIDCRLAVQSGPLMLDAGKIHHAFRDGSPNLKHRNGVGFGKSGEAVFAMTDRNQETNFHTFARLFVSLGCAHALFLDGDISQMAVNPAGKVESNLFAAMFVVVE